MLIKKNQNEELEKVLKQKDIDEQAKNLLQGILYKIEVAYKDYQKVKSKKQTEAEYVEEIIKNISKKCDKIKIVKPTQKLADEEIQKELDKNKFYVGKEIVSYPIEEKILYAIEKKSRNEKILNNKYGEIAITLSHLINEGKNMDRIEVLRDFNGWSWTTIKSEIENLEANLIYQTLQIMLGEEFLNNWCEDKDGIVDYLEEFSVQMKSQYGEKIAEEQKDLLIKISLANMLKTEPMFLQEITEKLQQITNQIEKYENTKSRIDELTAHKKEALKQINELEKVLGQNFRLKEEYERVNANAEIEQKIFNIKTFKRQLEQKKEKLKEQIEEDNYYLNPSNYIEEKNKLLEQTEEIQEMLNMPEQEEKLVREYLKNFLKCFEILIQNAKTQEEIIKLIYQLRYFILLPYKNKKVTKDIISLENKLLEKAIEKKVIVSLPYEIMQHVFETRIIILEDLYYEITTNDNKKYVQIFDENVSEDKFEIALTDNIKTNKKIKIFI